MNIIQTTNSKGVTTTATENGTVIMQSAHLEMDEATCGQCHGVYKTDDAVRAYENGPAWFCEMKCAVEHLDNEAFNAYEFSEGQEWFNALGTDALVILLGLIRTEEFGRAYDDEVIDALEARNFDFKTLR